MLPVLTIVNSIASKESVDLARQLVYPFPVSGGPPVYPLPVVWRSARLSPSLCLAVCPSIPFPGVPQVFEELGAIGADSAEPRARRILSARLSVLQVYEELSAIGAESAEPRARRILSARRLSVSYRSMRS